MSETTKPSVTAMRLALVAVLCAVAYAPALSIPLLEDDYPNLWESSMYGPLHALPVIAHNAVFRLRATTYWVMWPMWQSFHITPWPYHLFSLILHIANAWLVYAIARSWRPMRNAAFWAAAFFAVHEGHQEAVIWFSAVSELLMFLFGAASLLCWLLAWERNSRWLRVASPALFALALISKESAVVWLPLFLIASPARNRDEWIRAARRMAPHVVLALMAAASVWESRASSFRFNDGSFSLSAPFWMTWPRGVGRILWVWGWVSLAFLVAFAAVVRKRRGAAGAICKTPANLHVCTTKSILGALAWIAIGLMPYIFLTYSRQIPSRQTYLASAGLAFLAGLALASIFEVNTAAWRRAGSIMIAAMLVTNIGVLWTRKRAQFLERAEPTERLIRLARETKQPIWLKCYPTITYIAQEAVHLGAGRPLSDVILTEEEAHRRAPVAEFCYERR